MTTWDIPEILDWRLGFGRYLNFCITVYLALEHVLCSQQVDLLLDILQITKVDSLIRNI